MITLIHGDNITKSRDYYISERAKHPEKIILNGTSLTVTEFLQATSNSGLFGDQQTVFVEDLFSKRKPSKELEAMQSSIVNSQSSITLYESKELTKTQLKPFDAARTSDVTIKLFPIPKIVFSLLDAFTPGNGKKAISLFHQLLTTEDASFVLFMLQRQVRILLVICSQLTVHGKVTNNSEPMHMNQGISELSRLAPWQESKLKKQAAQFSLEQLIIFHDTLYQLELGQKTGTLSHPLDQAIDFFLFSL